MQASLERLRDRREKGGEGGFTLIELLIVIVILGILAAIVVFAVQNLTSQSAKASCGSDFKTVETALETYKAQVGHYPQIGNVAVVGPPAYAATAGDNWAPTPGGGVTPGATPDAAGASDGLFMLYATEPGVDGSTVGPWLKDAPTNGNLYQLNIHFTGADPSGDPSTGSDGTITVTNLSVTGHPTGTSCSAVNL